jgi:hypothetical protein
MQFLIHTGALMTSLMVLIAPTDLLTKEGTIVCNS